MEITSASLCGFECKRSESGKSGSNDDMVKVVKNSRGQFVSAASSHSQSILSRMLDMILSSFLPVGYPASVRPEYMTYQIYDSLQALCSYLRGVLCVHAVLIGAGVGQENGNALAAALAWVLKDGVGMMASIIFASSCSTFFTVYMKEWRLFADVINDVGQLLDMMSALVPSHLYVTVLSLSAICKAFCGVAAGATKLCITNHLARTNNAGDLVTKEGTQETAVTLLGLILGMFCAQSIAMNPHHAMALFLFLTGVHVWANYQAVYTLHVESINPSRGFLLTEEILGMHQTCTEMGKGTFEKNEFTSAMTASARFSVTHINVLECLTNTVRAVSWSQKIHLGCSLSSALNHLPTINMSKRNILDDLTHQTVKEFAARRCRYCLLPRSRPGEFSVLLMSTALPVDSFRAYLHCRLLQTQAQSTGHPISLNGIIQSIAAMNDMWNEVEKKLQAEGWDLTSHGLLFNCDDWCFSVKGTSSDIDVEESLSGEAVKKKQ